MLEPVQKKSCKLDIIVTLSLVLVFFLAPVLQAAEVVNLSYHQEGATIVLDYDLKADGEEEKAEGIFEVSLDGGLTWHQPKVQELFGDVGLGVPVGRGKKIYWDVLKDFPKGLDQKALSFRVEVPGRKGRLFVETKPQNAQVKIMNIVPKFHQGIELDPGRYDLEVSAEDYETYREWHEIEAGRDKKVEVVLAKRPETPRTFTNSIGQKFVLIPAGTFMMGSPPNEPERDSDEGPQHRVTISQPFYMQTTEVTQRQWRAVMGNNPSKFKNCGDDCPVEEVSWHDAQEFIRELNAKEGTDKYRLPTEAEWEYACRAGTETPWYCGDDKSLLREYAWYDGNSGGRTHRVGQKKPNAWGLYDMHGNVWEWVQDWYDEYPADALTDPAGPLFGDYRVLRGGSSCNGAGNVRSASRSGSGPGYRRSFFGGSFGFRLSKAK